MVDQQGGAEVYIFPVKPLILRIFSSYLSHGFLHSIYIMYKSSCGSRGCIHHEVCRYGYVDDTWERNGVSGKLKRQEAFSVRIFSLPG